MQKNQKTRHKQNACDPFSLDSDPYLIFRMHGKHTVVFTVIYFYFMFQQKILKAVSIAKKGNPFSRGLNKIQKRPANDT